MEESILRNIIIGAVVLSSSFIIGKLAIFISEKYLKKAFEKTETKLDDIILEIFEKNIFVVTLLVELKIAASLFEYGKYIKIKDYLTKGVDIFLIIVAAIILIKLINGLVKEVINTKGKKENQSKNYSIIIPLIENVGRISVWLIAAAMIVKALGYSPVSLLTGMGIVGVEVSFAAQNTIANFLSGIFIIFDGPFVLGDRIKMGENIGDVIEIGMRNTKVRTMDNLIITIPNSKITNSEVVNFSKPTNVIRVVNIIGVSYDSDLEAARKQLLDSMKKINGIVKDSDQNVSLIKFGNFSVEFEMGFWVEDFKKKGEVLNDLNFEIARRFKKEGIKIPYPTYDINIMKTGDNNGNKA